MQESVYSFMRFPRVASSKTISVNFHTCSSEFPSYKLEIPTVFNAEDIGLLDKLLTFSSDVSDKRVCILSCRFFLSLFSLAVSS